MHFQSALQRQSGALGITSRMAELRRPLEQAPGPLDVARHPRLTSSRLLQEHGIAHGFCHATDTEIGRASCRERAEISGGGGEEKKNKRSRAEHNLVIYRR